MKILVRLLRFAGFLITMPFVLFEVVVYGLRWIITGKDFPENAPLCVHILLGE